MLIVDESAVAKRGDHSAGAARQWCGATGKTDLCQVGVFLGYASRTGYTLLDRRLYLPREWFAADHRGRWAACRIPRDTPFASKAELAGRMIEAAVAGGLRAQWLTCDEGYGRDGGFLDRVAGAGLSYLAEVSKHTMAWPLLEPATGKARPRPGRGSRRATPPAKGERPSGAVGIRTACRRCGSMTSPRDCRPRRGDATGCWKGRGGRWWRTSPPCAPWRCATACRVRKSGRCCAARSPRPGSSRD